MDAGHEDWWNKGMSGQNRQLSFWSCALSLVKIQAYINIIMKTLGLGPMAEEHQPLLQDLSFGFWAKNKRERFCERGWEEKVCQFEYPILTLDDVY